MAEFFRNSNLPNRQTNVHSNVVSFCKSLKCTLACLLVKKEFRKTQLSALFFCNLRHIQGFSKFKFFKLTGSCLIFCKLIFFRGRILMFIIISSDKFPIFKYLLIKHNQGGHVQV